MKTFVTALLLCLPLVALAQQGTVLYEETIRLEIELPPEAKHMEKQFPTENTARKHLYFDGAVSLMKPAPEEEKEDGQLEAESGGMRIRMVAQRMNEEIYTDFDAGTQVEQRDFLGRTFLIRDAPPELAWRLTEERSEFLGYLCQKAVTTVRDSIQVEAWFTPEIPVPAGPRRDGGHRSRRGRCVSARASLVWCRWMARLRRDGPRRHARRVGPGSALHPHARELGRRRLAAGLRR